MKLTKEDKEELRREYGRAWRGDPKMADWCVQRASGVIRLRGYLIDIEKPHIETRFCFGEHGYDYDEVNDHCHRMSESEEYFMSENLDRCEAQRMLNLMDGTGRCWRKHVPYISPGRYGNGELRLASIHFLDSSSKVPSEMVLTEDERAELHGFLEEEVAKFEKRLRTYLKRYGLTKCQYWTYWADR